MCPEGRRIFANLTVEENLQRAARAARPMDIDRVYQLFPRLGERSRISAASFPAASRRCCRSAARCCSIRGC